MSPVISVVLPTFNRAGLLKRALLSVISQTYANWEVLVIDNNSTDDTDQVVHGLGDERIKILVQGVTKGKITDYVQTNPYYAVQIDQLPPAQAGPSSLETEAVIRTAKETLERLMSLGKILMPDVMVVIENLDEPGRLADIIISNLGLKVEVTQEILEIEDPVARLKQETDLLAKEIDVMSMQQKIQAEAKGEIDKTQREYFLREQLKAIQKELGELDERAEEAAEFRKRIQESGMTEKVLKEAKRRNKEIKEKKEAERKKIEANGIAEFQRIVNQTITPQLLKWKGVEATEEIAKSTNTKVVIVGNGDDDLPIILNTD